MPPKKLLLLLMAILLGGHARIWAQSCSTLGQTPSTAFPVCGTSTFSQNTVPLCDNGPIPVPGCSRANANYTAVNPFWYRFTCFKSGTLGFQIVPNTLSDDYDWQLFDITGQDPNNVFSISSLVISGNWSANPGSTGTRSGGAGSSNCAGYGYSNQNSMPSLIQGHEYLLLVSHFTETQSGYSLQFSGGTASITDTTTPNIQRAQVACDGASVMILLNKNMTCASLAADGSDFSLSPGPVKIIGAMSKSCRNGFTMDTVILYLSTAVSPGNYTITTKKGSDQNTLLDICGNSLAVGITASFVKTPAPLPTPMDSIAPPGCAPGVLKLVFNKGIHCSSIAADGSDFKVTGPVPVNITGASGLCDDDGNSPVILVKLGAQIVTGGTYRITLVSGSDGNTIVDECGQTTPAGATLNFNLKDTVSAYFTDKVNWGCRNDTISYFYEEKNGVNQWQWIFDGSDTVTEQDPVKIYQVFGPKTAILVVSNGVCSDTSALVTIDLNNGIKAIFETENIICPADQATFVNTSTGNIDAWTWSFGDGSGSTDQTPGGHLYPVTGVESKYDIQLIVHSGICADTTMHQIDVLRSCLIAVPSAFTPNGDGVNDYFYPLNAFKADNLQFRVFNRWGQQVFLSENWLQKWDGTINGHPQPAGTYVWSMQYTDRDTGQKVVRKGTVILIR